MKNLIKLLFLSILIVQSSGCGTSYLKDMDKTMATVGALYISQSMSIALPANIFYKEKNRWPNDIDELRKFVKGKGEEDFTEGMKKSDVPILSLSNPRFDNTDFRILPEGGLEVMLPESDYILEDTEKSLRLPQSTFTIHESEDKVEIKGKEKI